MNFNEYLSIISKPEFEELFESKLNESNLTKFSFEGSITKEQKREIFAGCTTKNKLYMKKFNRYMIVVVVDKWKMSGNAINDISGQMYILNPYMRKDNTIGYRLNQHSVSMANNVKFKKSIDISNELAKYIMTELGAKSVFKDSVDLDDTTYAKIDPKDIEVIK